MDATADRSAAAARPTEDDASSRLDFRVKHTVDVTSGIDVDSSRVDESSKTLKRPIADAVVDYSVAGDDIGDDDVTPGRPEASPPSYDEIGSAIAEAKKLTCNDSPVDLIITTLSRTDETDSFGFSLSNGVYEYGVYVGAVKSGGSADGKLIPFDRILQVRISLHICREKSIIAILLNILHQEY